MSNLGRGLFLGTLAGITIGVLMAPKAGKEIREELKKHAENLRNEAEEHAENAKEVVDRTATQAKRAVDKTATEAKKAVDKAEKLATPPRPRSDAPRSAKS